MSKQTFENVVQKMSSFIRESGSIVMNFNAYNGWCIKKAGDASVYLVMNGQKCCIPNMDTLSGIFASNDIHDGTSLVGELWTKLVDQMPTGSDIANGAQLIKADNADAVFLLTNRRKYGITSGEQFEACNFGWKKIHIYPAIVVDAIPDGGNTAFDRTGT